MARELFPDVLSYVVGTPATYGFAVRNGRRLADNAPEVMLSLVVNTAVPSGLQASVAERLRSGNFPYVMRRDPLGFSGIQPDCASTDDGDHRRPGARASGPWLTVAARPDGGGPAQQVVRRLAITSQAALALDSPEEQGRRPTAVQDRTAPLQRAAIRRKRG